MAELTRRGGRAIRRRDHANSGVEGIKRNFAGTIQMQNVLNTTGSPVTGITGNATTTTKTDRAFASSATVVLTTTNSPTAGTMTLSRGGSSVTNVTGITNTVTLSPTQNTFTSAPATWTVNIKSIAGGTATLKTWVQQKEASR